MNDYAVQTKREAGNGNGRRVAVDVMEIRADETVYYSVFAPTMKEAQQILRTMPVTRVMKHYKI